MMSSISDNTLRDISKAATECYCQKISKIRKKSQNLLKFRHTGAKQM